MIAKLFDRTLWKFILVVMASLQSVQENGAMLAGMRLFAAFNYVGQRFFALKSEN